MYNHTIGGTQQRRQASARHPPMQVTGDNRTASHSASRQQQSGSNLHLMPRPPAPGHKKMKLIKTRVSGNTTVSVNEKKQRLKSPTTAGPSIDSRTRSVRQQSLNLSSNQFLKSPTSASQTTKNQPAASYRQQQNQDHFLFSATSPPVQINKQAIMMNASHQQATRPIQGKQKESLGHITASRRQKQTGLQINVDGCQSIVINSPSRGHVIASPQAKPGVPDNILFYGQGQPKSTMSPQNQHGMDSLNQMSPKGAMQQHHSSQYDPNQNAHQPRRQQQSSMSKKLLRQKVVTQDKNSTYDTFKNPTNLHIGSTNTKGNKQPANGLNGYQITPKNGNGPFDQMAPRSTKARTSQHFVKGRFIEQHHKNDVRSPKREHTMTNQATMSTLEQQRQQQLSKGFSPRRVQGDFAEGTADEAASLLFMQSPPPPRRSSNRMVSPNTYNPRASAHSSYNNRNKQTVKATTKNTQQNNSSLGFKTGTTGNLQNGSNTLKIQNIRVYNETSASAHNSKVAPATTKAEQSQRYAMRNNFTSPTNGQPIGAFVAPDRNDQMARHGQGSNLRHFQNQSSSSATVNIVSAPKQGQQKKRKLTLNQRSTTGNKNNSSYTTGVMGATKTMRPMSGVVNGANRNAHQSYSLRTNVTYVSTMKTSAQMTAMNSSQRQSTSSATRGKNMQILATESEAHGQQRIYSPNAAMNGRRDINQELQNLAVPQFYPQTTTSQQAPRNIQFTQNSTTTTQAAGPQQPQELNEISSVQLMEEPEIGGSDIRSSMNIKDQHPSTGTSQNMVSASNLSMEQPSSNHQFNSQHTVISSQRRQSRHLQPHENQMISGGSQDFSNQLPLANKLTDNEQRRSVDHKKSSRQSNIVEINSDQQVHTKPPELRSNDISGPLVIPNFSINLPQSTTASMAPKNGEMILNLDPISKNKNEINQKIQQRKIESARRPSDNQPQALNIVKPNSNLQVMVTHDINPIVGLASTSGYNQVPQSTKNPTTGAMVPSLNFQQPQQPSVQRLNTGHSNAAQSQRENSQRHQIQAQQKSHRSNAASSHRSQANESYNSGTQKRQPSNAGSRKQSPSKAKTQQSSKSINLNQQSANGSRAYLQKDQQNALLQQQQIKFPTTPAKALKLFGSKHLTEYEKTEILDFPQVYYFGEGVKKIQAQKPKPDQIAPKFGNRESSKNRNNSQAEEEDTNCGYDDSKGNYRVIMKDHIAYRYEMVEHLGRGSFGVAIKCFDHKTQEMVAIKIIKNKKKYYYQAGVELKILQYLKDNDPDDTMNIIHMKDYVIFRKHLCITFELMSINLYEFLKLNDFEGLSLSLVRRFAIQLLYSLKFLKENDVIHCDLKPENILLKDPSKSGIKIIDFGSSCFQDERVYTYIQSRFYRAPEIILGIPYTPCIDMWSFGCIMAEFAMGYPIFPGEDETDQISLIMEVCGIPAAEVLAKGQRKTKFFNESNMPKLVPNSHGKVRKPGTKVLDDILECSDQSFVNFVERCLEWDPEKRMTPDEAIRHQWILEGLPPKVLVHHQKLHNIATKSLPAHIKEQRSEYLATQPLDVQVEFRDDDEEESESSSYRQNSRQPRNAAHQPKSKSLDRTAGQQNQNQASSGHQQQQQPTKPNRIGSAHPQTQATRNQRTSQSFDGTAGGYRQNNVSANVNAQQHHNQRQKKQVGVLKSSADSKPSVEQMLHGSQRQ